jgi:hypothetical protein
VRGKASVKRMQLLNGRAILGDGYHSIAGQSKV